MKKFLILCFTGILILSNSYLSTGQVNDVGEDHNTKLLNAAREIMISSRFCALITIDEDGQPRARTMDAFEPDSNFMVWFGTKAGTRKIGQIEKNPVTTLYYFHEEANGYVTLHGKAYIINDKENKANWWKEEWAEFYPNNRESYVLIKFVPETMEVYSSVLKIDADPDSWAPPVVRFLKPVH